MSIVYVVHGVDVEGPMTETLEATFERMWGYGLSPEVRPERATLEAIQAGTFPGLEPGLATTLKQVFNPRSLSYYTDWQQIDAMIREVNSPEFRRRHCSQDGSPYLLSWFIYDHHDDFTSNPRFHEVGTHKIFDHYMDLFRTLSFADGIYWHYHPPSSNGNALESNTCWTNHTTHENIVSRRIIERNWYFSCFRAGLHLERNDMSHWLEMFIPFDFSARFSPNTVYAPGGDFDWRGCPDRWGAWHPDWYDYRKPGSMRRWLFRCTDLWTYLNVLNGDEVAEAFAQAREHGDSVLTYYNHDYRDMRREIADGYQVLLDVAARFPDVEWKFVTALEAAQRHLRLQPESPGLSYSLEGSLLTVRAERAIFGPQPFLAIQEQDRFFRDNFTDEGGNTWCYRFRNPADVRAFGVAASSPSGVYDLLRHGALSPAAAGVS